MRIALVALLTLATCFAQAPRKDFEGFAARVRAYPRLHRAYRLIEQGKLTEARRSLERALELQPDDVDARRAYALLLFGMKDYRASIPAADAVLSSLPADGTAALYRAMSLDALRDDDSAAAGYRAAIATLRGADRTYALNALAEVEIRRGRPAEAALAVETIPPGDRDLASRKRLAMAYEKTARIEPALLAWTSVLELNSRDTGALVAIRDLHYRAGRFRESLDAARRIDSNAPTRANTEFETQLLVKLRDFESADAMLRKRLAGSPPSGERRHLLLLQADLAQRRGNLALERSILTRAADLGVSQAVFRRLASLAEREGDLTEARHWYRRSLALKRNVDDTASLANLEFQLGNWAESIRLNREVLPSLKQPANQARLLLAIGLAEQRRGGLPEAIAAFEGATRLVPPPAGRSELATAYELSGNPARAGSLIEEALAANRDPALLLRLSVLRASRGELSASRRLAEEALPRLQTLADRATAYRQIGYAAEAAGDLQAARRAFESALTAGGDGADVLRALVGIALRLGDGAAALRYARRLNATDFDSQLLTARAEAMAGDPTAAIATLNRMLDPPAPADAWRVLATIAELELKRERFSAAAETLVRAATMPNAPRRDLLEQAAGHLIYTKDLEAARRIYVDLADAYRDDPARRAAMLERVGDLESALGRDADASASYRAALDAGVDTTLRLAHSLVRQRKWGEAAPLFERSYARTPSPDTARSVAECYLHLNRPKDALTFLIRTLPPDPALPAAVRAARYREVAYLSSDTGDPDRALAYWTEAQKIEPAGIVAVRMAATELRLGRPVAIDALDSIPAASLTGSELVEYLDLRGALLERAGRRGDAIQAYEDANRRQPAASRYLHLGGLYREAGRNSEAIEAYRAALKSEPAQPQTAASLAYVLQEEGRAKEAISLLEPVSRTPPMDAQLGYLYRAESRNTDAIRTFDTALPGLAPTEARQVRLDRAELARHFSWNVYWTLASPGLQDSSFLGTGYGAAVPSQGGAELHWRPPVIGFRNDRIFTVFARVLWGNRLRSAAIDSESWQAGVGVRYKPLRRQNLYLSGERLIKLGDNTFNSWLFRSMYSINHGETPWVTPRRTNYSTAFADIAFFTATPQTWLYFGQTRQGVSFPLTPQLLLSPHATLEIRYQDRARQRVGYLQGGGGIALNYALQRHEDRPSWGRLEMLLQYRSGSFFNRHPALDPRTNFSGWFFSVALIR